jgi:hypothetical protein
MATLSTPQKTARKTWTVADLYHRFGPIPFERIRHDPPPGCGTVDDVVRLNDHEDRRYELVDGIGFAVEVGELFEMPMRPGAKGEQKKIGPQSGKKNGPRCGR